jgi:hypothetical protein
MVIFPEDEGRMNHINYSQIWLFSMLEFRNYTNKYKLKVILYWSILSRYEDIFLSRGYLGAGNVI